MLKHPVQHRDYEFINNKIQASKSRGGERWERDKGALTMSACLKMSNSSPLSFEKQYLNNPELGTFFL